MRWPWTFCGVSGRWMCVDRSIACAVTHSGTHRVEQDVGGLEVPVDDRLLGFMEEGQPFGSANGDLQPCWPWQRRRVFYTHMYTYIEYKKLVGFWSADVIKLSADSIEFALTEAVMMRMSKNMYSWLSNCLEHVHFRYHHILSSLEWVKWTSPNSWRTHLQ